MDSREAARQDPPGMCQHLSPVSFATRRETEVLCGVPQGGSGSSGRGRLSRRVYPSMPVEAVSVRSCADPFRDLPLNRGFPNRYDLALPFIAKLGASINPLFLHWIERPGAAERAPGCGLSARGCPLVPERPLDPPAAPATLSPGRTGWPATPARACRACRCV